MKILNKTNCLFIKKMSFHGKSGTTLKCSMLLSSVKGTCVCVRACARACVRACVCVCVCVGVGGGSTREMTPLVGG